MTHPLTPREKVAAVVLDAAASYLIQQYGASHGLDHEVDRERIISAIPNDAILTALASGSGDQLSGNPGILKYGDHAELVRLEAMLEFFEGSGPDAMSATESKQHAVDMRALLAENAALRAERDHFEAEFRRQCGASADQMYRATEAERKLAEAVGVVEWYGENARLARLIHSEGDAGRNALADDGGKRARTFLSKEAERG